MRRAERQDNKTVFAPRHQFDVQWFGSIDGVSESCVDLYCLFYHSPRRLETEGTASGLARSLGKKEKMERA